MPWVACDEQIEVGPLRLVPYERRKRPGLLHGITQASLDGVLGSYGDPQYFPSRSASTHARNATLLSWQGDSLDLEFSDDQIIQRLLEAQYVAFAALTARQLASHFGYSNSDALQTIAQRFDPDSPGATAVTVRRRDGSSMNYVGTSTRPRFIRPLHVGDRVSLNIDAPLLEALLRLPDGPDKARIDDAIDLFVKANTDSAAMPERTEVVLVRAAFETLLQATHEASDLRQRLSAHFAAELPAAVWSKGELSEAIWRARWPKHVNRPVDAWIQDFCASRNAAAHGPSAAHAPTVWPSRNHLMFVCLLLPLMVKKTLADVGVYSLSDTDRAVRAGFEAFFAHDVLSRREPNVPELWWTWVERKLLFDLRWSATFSNSADG